MSHTEYQDERGFYIPFASNMHQEIYRKWVTYAFWERLKLRDVIADALEAYLKNKPNACRSLPPKQEAILGWKIQRKRAHNS